MSGMPDVNSTRMTIRLPLELKTKLRAKVRRSNGELSESDVAVLALIKTLADVQLELEDLEWVKEQLLKNKKAREMRSNRR